MKFFVSIIFIGLVFFGCMSNTPSQEKSSDENKKNTITSYNKQSDNSSIIIGARTVTSSPLEMGKLFASPNGNGDCMSLAHPCDIYTAISKLSREKKILFLKGGIYKLNKRIFLNKSATQEKPYIIESIDSENKAILKSSNYSGNAIKIYQAQYIHLKNLEIQDYDGFGVRIRESSHITVEGCSIHDNKKSAISLYGASECIIKDNKTYNNTDDNVGNADGIQIEIHRVVSENNIISHNTVYNNSDDGIDAIAGVNTVIKYNISYGNLGIDPRGHGNGLGIKACGKSGRGSKVEHNIAFNNIGNGFECNGNNGEGVIFQYNTAYNNGNYGFEISTENSVAKLLKNIASKNKNIEKNTNGIQSNNSWDRADEVTFISTDPNSPNFLKPLKGSGLEDIGAYATVGNNGTKEAKIFVIGDSTTFNHDTRDQQGNLLEMGWAEREALGKYMKNLHNLYDEGRSGASSKSYKIALDNQHNWEETKRLITHTDISQGAYLLVQFGHNDEKIHQSYGTTTEEFYQELSVYVDWAKNNGVIPILITPVERRAKSKGNQNHKTHKEAGGYAQVVRNLAHDKGVILLDLQEKSWRIYNTYTDSAAINAELANDDDTHFSPAGAYIVAGWVKELICQSNAQTLCAQFK